MKNNDEFSDYHADLLDGRYDCVDRIVLNGYFALGQQGGGVRYWWCELTGSDETLDQEHLRELAGRFSRRVHADAKRRRIPLRHTVPPGCASASGPNSTGPPTRPSQACS